jgi:hypothetical protein
MGFFEKWLFVLGMKLLSEPKNEILVLSSILLEIIFLKLLIFQAAHAPAAPIPNL